MATAADIDARATIDDVRPRTTEEAIIAVATRDVVVPGPAPDDVFPSITAEQIRPRRPEKAVILWAADCPLDTAEVVSADSLRDAVGKADDDGPIVATVRHGIEASVTENMVVSKARVEHVVPSAASQHVIPGPAEDRILASETADDVNPTRATKHVIAVGSAHSAFPSACLTRSCTCRRDD
jgi:hypothetical protein